MSRYGEDDKVRGWTVAALESLGRLGLRGAGSERAVVSFGGRLRDLGDGGGGRMAFDEVLMSVTVFRGLPLGRLEGDRRLIENGCSSSVDLERGCCCCIKESEIASEVLMSITVFRGRPLGRLLGDSRSIGDGAASAMDFARACFCGDGVFSSKSMICLELLAFGSRFCKTVLEGKFSICGS